MPTNTYYEIVPITAGDSRPDAGIETLLDDGGRSRTLRRTLFGIVLLAALFVAWALMTEIDELAKARGEIQPSGRVQLLQSEAGGTILTLYVNEGDTVSEGQPIADFAASDLGKLKTQTDIKLASLEIDRERLRALLENRQPDFSPFAADYPLLVEQGILNFQAGIANRDAALSAKSSDMAQQEALLAGAVREKALVSREVKEGRERLGRVEEGARRGVVTQLALSEARQQVSSLEERQSTLIAREIGTRSAIKGIEAEIGRLRAELNQQLGLELSKVIEQYRELVAERQALNERLGRSDIKAPVGGVIMNLPQSGAGSVIPPGGVVAEIVPTGKEIVMEAMVSPRDIGFVQVGQRASVKIDSFDSARFGSIEGHVKRVAPTSTKLKENGMPFYKVEISLSKPYVGSTDHRLIPGMTGEADIATGRKSVMQYLLKPVFLASDTAFHER